MKNKVDIVYSNKHTEYMALDTETTGLDHEKNSIIELAAIKLDEKLRPDMTTSFRTLVRPFDGCVISPQAIKINKHNWVYDKNSAQWQFAPQCAQAWNNFAEWRRQHFTPYHATVLVGWNIGFDEQFLKAMFKRANMRVWPFHYHKIDCLAVCRYLDIQRGYSRKSYRLESVARTYLGKIAEFQMHTALGDAQMCVKVLHKVQAEIHDFYKGNWKKEAEAKIPAETTTETTTTTTKTGAECKT